MKVSIFKNFQNRERITSCDAEELARIIRDGGYADVLTDYRCYSRFMFSGKNGTAGKYEAKVADNRIPRICFSSVYKRYKGERVLLGHGGLLFLDICGLKSFDEAVSLRRQASRQPYTRMAFVGASGLSVIVVCSVSFMDGNIPADEGAWRRLMAEGYRLLHYVYSSQLRVNIPLLEWRSDAMCLMSVDSGIYYNGNSLCMAVGRDSVGDVFKIQHLYKSDVEESPLPGMTAAEAYRHIFYCCWNHVLDSGLSRDDDYFAEKAVQMLASLCHKSGLPRQLCVDRTMGLDGVDADRNLVEMLFAQAYKCNLAYSNPVKCVDAPMLQAMKLDNFFKTRYIMRRNVLTGVVQYKRIGAYDSDFKPVTQEVINTIAVKAQREGIKVWARDIKERVNSTLVSDFNPLNDWLELLPEWDGHDRIKAFASRVPTDNPCWVEFFSIWMRSMVAQWMRSDAMHGNDLVPLLIGNQGCGKSSFTKIILPPELRAYYNDRIDFRNDNTLMQGLTAFALINIDEFDRYSNSRQPIMKYIISKSEVTAVKAYRSTFSTERRHASFIATTNCLHPLTDPTGSRRFICLAVNGNIDFITPVDYQQLYAQIKHEIRNGAPCFLDSAATTRLMDANRCFMRVPGLGDAVTRLFRVPEAEGSGQELSVDDIISLVCHSYPYLPSSGMSRISVGICLKRLGFKGRHTRTGMLYRVEQIR